MQEKAADEAAPEPLSKKQSEKSDKGPISADLFLFQQIVIDVLSFCKKNMKIAPFEDMQVDSISTVIFRIGAKQQKSKH